MRHRVNVERYLERIGYFGGREPSAENLAALLRAHRVAVPYETLDLWRGVRTSLELDALYEKIVVRRRGGYCLELSGLFAALLRELGYEVREYEGRWLWSNSSLPVPRRCHRVVCARVGEGPAKIVDAGVGLPCLTEPLEVVLDKPQLCGGRYYRLVRDERLGIVVEMMWPDGTWKRLFSFDTAPCEPTDFDYPHWWCETHPDSVFRRVFRVFRLTAEGGWKEILGEPRPSAGEPLRATFVEHDATGAERRTELADEAAFNAALSAAFGIDEPFLI